jgi:hypothetical protein
MAVELSAGDDRFRAWNGSDPSPAFWTDVYLS